MQSVGHKNPTVRECFTRPCNELPWSDFYINRAGNFIHVNELLKFVAPLSVK